MKLPKWLEEKYDLLWDKFEDREFRSTEALEILGKEHLIDEKSLSAAISEMRKKGWIETRKDPADERRSIYMLRPKSEIIQDYLTLKDDKLGRADIERILKGAADLIRTRVDYKFILVLLFMKQMSDKWMMEYQKAYEDAIKEYGLSEEEARLEARNSAYHDLDIKEDTLGQHKEGR